MHQTYVLYMVSIITLQLVLFWNILFSVAIQVSMFLVGCLSDIDCVPLLCHLACSEVWTLNWIWRRSFVMWGGGEEREREKKREGWMRIRRENDMGKMTEGKTEVWIRERESEWESCRVWKCMFIRSCRGWILYSAFRKPFPPFPTAFFFSQKALTSSYPQCTKGCS